MHVPGQPSLQLSQDLDQLLALDRLDHVADGAQRECRLGVIACRDDMDRDVARLDVAFQPVEDGESGLVGQSDIEHDRVGHELLGERDRFFGRSGNQAAETHFARQVAQDGGEGIVVLDDQEAAAAVGRRFAIVIDLPGWPGGRGAGRRAYDRRDDGRARADHPRFARGYLGRVVRLGKGDREGAALARPAHELDRASSRRASSREIESPRPVPPYRRLIVLSA